MNNHRGGLSRFALLQLLLMAAVVTAFVANSILDMRSYWTLARDVGDIAGNAMPSVHELTHARGVLRQMDEYLEQRVTESGPEATRIRDGLGGLRQDLDASLASYRNLPYFEGERALYGEVGDAKAAFDKSADDALDAVAAGDREAARAALGLAGTTSNRLDLALERVIAFNAEQGERVAERAVSAWQGAAMRNVLVDVVVGLLAMVATVISAIVWRRALVVARQRSSELDSFAGRVAHDVLSPLQSVGLGLGLLRLRLGDDSGSLAVADRSARSLDRVRSLVTSLLAFARAGGSPTEGTADVSETIRGVLDGLEADAAAAQVELVLERSVDRRVACAPGVLTSVVQNLVGNAIKYMDEARVRRTNVRVRDDGAFVRVEVQDTGPGIPEAIRDEIFEPFVRGTDAVEGAGLGLATVKRLIDAHGGRVGCESAPGQGSVFWFELPRATPSAGSGRT
jgi:signal transduction histidine kinase